MDCEELKVTYREKDGSQDLKVARRRAESLRPYMRDDWLILSKDCGEHCILTNLSLESLKAWGYTEEHLIDTYPPLPADQQVAWPSQKKDVLLVGNTDKG